MKICKKCQKEKSEDQFYKAKTTKDRLGSCCKDCVILAAHDRYAKKHKIKRDHYTRPLVVIENGLITCRWCNRKLPIDKMAKYKGRLGAKCCACDNLRRSNPEAWKNRNTPGVIYQAHMERIEKVINELTKEKKSLDVALLDTVKRNIEMIQDDKAYLGQEI